MVIGYTNFPPTITPYTTKAWEELDSAVMARYKERVLDKVVRKALKKVGIPFKENTLQWVSDDGEPKIFKDIVSGMLEKIKEYEMLTVTKGQKIKLGVDVVGAGGAADDPASEVMVAGAGGCGTNCDCRCEAPEKSEIMKKWEEMEKDDCRVVDCCGVFGYLIPWADWKTCGRAVVPTRNFSKPFIYIYSVLGQLGVRAQSVVPGECKHPNQVGEINIDPYVDVESKKVAWQKLCADIGFLWEDWFQGKRNEFAKAENDRLREVRFRNVMGQALAFLSKRKYAEAKDIVSQLFAMNQEDPRVAELKAKLEAAEKRLKPMRRTIPKSRRKR